MPDEKSNSGNESNENSANSPSVVETTLKDLEASNFVSSRTEDKRVTRILKELEDSHYKAS
jgi:DNA-binding PadR family transcriptional regulator